MEVLRVVVLSVDPPLDAEKEPDPPPTSFLPLSLERTQEMMTTSHSEPWKTYKNTMLIAYSKMRHHSLIIGVLIQSCSVGAKNFTNYVSCHPQFSGVIQNIENHCAILIPVCLCRLLSK